MKSGLDEAAGFVFDHGNGRDGLGGLGDAADAGRRRRLRQGPEDLLDLAHNGVHELLVQLRAFTDEELGLVHLRQRTSSEHSRRQPQPR
jgi:hypothetical protein